MLDQRDVMPGRQLVRAEPAGLVQPQAEFDQRVAPNAGIGCFAMGVAFRERLDDPAGKRLVQIKHMQGHAHVGAQALKPRNRIVFRRGVLQTGVKREDLSRILAVQGGQRVQAVRSAAHGYGYGHGEVLLTGKNGKTTGAPAPSAGNLPSSLPYKEKGDCRRATSPKVESLRKRDRGGTFLQNGSSPVPFPFYLKMVWLRSGPTDTMLTGTPESCSRRCT